MRSVKFRVALAGLLGAAVVTDAAMWATGADAAQGSEPSSPGDVRSRAEDLARRAHERFNELISDKDEPEPSVAPDAVAADGLADQLHAWVAKSGLRYQLLVRRLAEPASYNPVEEAAHRLAVERERKDRPAPVMVADAGLIEQGVEWVHRSGRDYQELMRRLSVPADEAAATPSGPTEDVPKSDEPAHVAQPSEAEKPVERAKKAAEAQEAEEAKTAEEAKKAEEERRTAEAKRAEEARQAEEAKKAEEEVRRVAEAKKAEEVRLAEEARRAEEAKKAEEERRTAEAKRAEEARQAEEARKTEEAKKAEEEARRIAEARKAEEARLAEDARKAEEAKKTEEEARRVAEARKIEEAQPTTQTREAAEAKTSADAPRRTAEAENKSESAPMRKADSAKEAAVKPREHAVRHKLRSKAQHARACRLAGRKASTPGWYVVEKGDTLWDIAKRHYGKGWRYDLIYKANADRIDDPDLIYPCQRFYLPKLRRRRG